MQVRSLSVAVLGLALASTPAAAEVRLTINGGRVSLTATDATVSQILAEWAKVGQTKSSTASEFPAAGHTRAHRCVRSRRDRNRPPFGGGYLLAPRSRTL